MKTAEETYIQYLCKNCKNKQTDLCCIRRRIDNTLYCNSYEKDKEVKGYIDKIRLSIKLSQD